MTDEEVRQMILSGKDLIKFPITMEERAKLYILPWQLQQKFLEALDRFLEGQIIARLGEPGEEKRFKEWMRVRRKLDVG